MPIVTQRLLEDHVAEPRAEEMGMLYSRQHKDTISD